jgi:hypothetical protein
LLREQGTQNSPKREQGIDRHGSIPPILELPRLLRPILY